MIVALAAALLAPPPPELAAYVRKKDKSAAWREARRESGFVELKLTSQTWQGAPWTHDLVVASPRSGTRGSGAILLITGDRAGGDLPYAQSLADQAGMEVAVLFEVPNQPLYGLNEDALIAYTFGQWLQTGDNSWPLLFPMTKSAMKAMDALQEWSGRRLKSFVVTGASKRGWTTWLTAALGDKRIKGIAPMVIDTLKMPEQLAKQREMFGGKLSEQIADYSETGLTEVLSTPQGQKLTRMVDPASYLGQVRVPVLVLVGGNDRYWTVDAHSLYWNDIRSPKLMRVIPNRGHEAGNTSEAVASVAFFSRAALGLSKGGVPRIPWTPGGLDLAELADDRRFKGSESWVATAEGLDFRDSRWMDAKVVRLDPRFNRARFLEYQFEDGGLRASFTSGVVVERASR
jgi:PhoPQ-activated pathogenicity-related protein